MRNQSEQIRNDNYHTMWLHGDLSAGCVRALRAIRAYGPGTTKDLAHQSGINILTLRPRITDLLHAGLVRICGHRGREGIYAAATPQRPPPAARPPGCVTPLPSSPQTDRPSPSAQKTTQPYLPGVI